MHLRRSVALLLVSLPLLAQSWPTFFSAYEDGLAAQARGDHALAVKAFARASSLNPRPGQRVRTYGLNFLPTYHPYLRLAESNISLSQLDAAEATLKQSEAYGLEPPAEREGLAAKVRTLRNAQVRTSAPPQESRAEAGTAEQGTPHPATNPSSASGVRSGPASPSFKLPEARPPLPETASQPSQPLHPVQAPPRASAAQDRSTTPLPALPATDAGPRTTRSEVSLAPQPDTGRHSKWIWIPGSGMALALGAVLASRAKKRRAGSTSTTILDREGQALPVPPTPSSDQEMGGTGDPNLGRCYGPYLATGVLGQGGCATTYLGHHRETGVEVAIKVPHRHLLQDGDFKARFHREASLGALLHHARIVPIIDPGPVEGEPWLAMPFIQGITLDHHLSQKRVLDVPEAISIACDISEAIGFAHSKGIVHRDLKPGNVMMTGDGAIVMDFGIARVLDGSLTVSTMFLGTPLYSAPECVVTPRVGPPADRYALGIMLFEFLAGSPPFNGESPFQILEAQRSQPLPDLPTHASRVPPRLVRLIQRLCAKLPEERPEDGETSIILNELKKEFPRVPPVILS